MLPLLAVLTAVAGTPAPLTDAEVLTLANARVEGGGLDEGDVCITRPGGFPGTVAIGAFRHDRGCHGWMWIVDGVVHGDPQAATAAVFATEAVTDARFLDWAVDALLAFDGIEHGEKAPERFRGGRYHPPRVKRVDGGLVVEAWARDPVGMRPAPPSWHAVSAQFAVAGTPAPAPAPR